MNEDHLQKVRERAHALWEQAGRPHGKDAAHWAQAEQEIAAENDAQSSAPAGKSTARRGRKPGLSADQAEADAPKAKRGRAAKSEIEVLAKAPNTTRGRRPKVVPAAGTEQVKVARGRRPKATAEVAAAADRENAPAAAANQMPKDVADGSGSAE
ncbi:DUF2934 domain-containing protein [Paracoccus actinidiae]|uniref:DUF2934 domain-containing protein n=1 Tax=Paracoccus actinidiae TaxID=3064531 RepID=UPI0027D2815A|nr:DUF2934 domain-containing protein [Paracoccus sp. M09]